MAEVKIEWETTPEDMVTQLYDDYMRNIKMAVTALVVSFAPRIESWMKQNAIWTDRTGNARQGLYAQLESLAGLMTADELTLIFDHSMHYGWFLETSNAGKFQIIDPAMDYWFPKIVEDIRKLLQ